MLKILQLDESRKRKAVCAPILLNDVSNTVAADIIYQPHGAERCYRGAQGMPILLSITVYLAGLQSCLAGRAFTKTVQK